MQKLSFNAKLAEFKIQNIVGSCGMKFPIRLEGLAYSHGEFSSYEPEVRYLNLNAGVVFIHIHLAVPRLIYRMPKPKVVLLIFVKGR